MCFAKLKGDMTCRSRSSSFKLCRNHAGRHPKKAFGHLKAKLSVRILLEGVGKPRDVHLHAGKDHPCIYALVFACGDGAKTSMGSASLFRRFSRKAGAWPAYSNLSSLLNRQALQKVAAHMGCK